MAEFAGREDIDIVEDTFIRQELPNGKEVKVYFTYNPPRNPYDWINEWVAEKASDPTYLIHHSTYLNDRLGFLSRQIKEKIENIKFDKEMIKAASQTSVVSGGKYEH